MSVLSVYPISRSRHKTRAAVAALRRAHIKVQLDWTKNEKRTYDAADAAIAIRDWAAAADADITLMLWCDGMRGAWVEMGIALQAGRRVWVVGAPDADYNIFFRVPAVRLFPSLGDAMHAIRMLDQDMSRWAARAVR